jgi:hypothetical protein
MELNGGTHQPSNVKYEMDQGWTNFTGIEWRHSPTIMLLMSIDGYKTNSLMEVVGNTS